MATETVLIFFIRLKIWKNHHPPGVAILLMFAFRPSCFRGTRYICASTGTRQRRSGTLRTRPL